MAADLNGFLLNYFIGGEMGTVRPDGRWIRNKIELLFGGRDLTIIQSPEIITARASKFKGQAVPTTTVVVHNVRVEERETVLDLLQGLTHLLSFATVSDVALYGWEHQDSPPLKERWRVVAQMGYFRPPFEIHDRTAMRAYLERVWREYFRLEETRKLRVAIDLFVKAETRGLPLELKLATMFILLENLKSTFATEQSHPFRKGAYIKVPRKRWFLKICYPKCSRKSVCLRLTWMLLWTSVMRLFIRA